MDAELWETFYEWYGEPATEWVEARRKLKKKRTTVGQLIEMLQGADDQPAEEYLRKVLGEQKTMW
jgi:hypothetical protein